MNDEVLNKKTSDRFNDWADELFEPKPSIYKTKEARLKFADSRIDMGKTLFGGAMLSVLTGVYQLTASNYSAFVSFFILFAFTLFLGGGLHRSGLKEYDRVYQEEQKIK